METIRPHTADVSTFWPHLLDKVPQDILKKAEMELNETPERRKEAIKELRRLIHAEGDFRPIMEDKFLLRFLRAKKFNSQRAFNMLKNFYTFKVRYSKVLTDFKPSEVKHVYDQNVLGILPYRDNEGCAIGIGRIGIFDFNKASINELFAAALVVGETCIDLEATQICGVVIVLDCKGISLKTIRQLASPTLLFRIVKVIQDCFPTRFKALHIVNEPFYTSLVFNIIKPFLSEKIKKRLRFHGSSLRNLHQFVPRSLLPEELGGDLGPFDCSECIESVLSNEDIYERNSKYGYQTKKAQFIRKRSSLSFGLYV